ncbi:MAG: carbohydrate porin [Deltaproteobacteria bacterium]|nr:carbohydrate porin [Deltaproteobacteria bacterium]
MRLSAWLFGLVLACGLGHAASSRADEPDRSEAEGDGKRDDAERTPATAEDDEARPAKAKRRDVVPDASPAEPAERSSPVPAPPATAPATSPVPITAAALPPVAPGPEHRGAFHFGSYGRVAIASDGTGRPARESDIVAYGSRLDTTNYVELELRREDRWEKVGIDTRIISTLAIANSIFHFDGKFDSQIAVRNLYIEASGVGTKGVSVWAGSRMYRGDDIYLLNFWPLDNLNTLGAGVRYEAPTRTVAQVHMGFGQPDSPFYKQRASRPAPLNQFGAATIDLLDRQRWIGSARLEQGFRLGDKAGMKVVGYGEGHRLPAGERESAREGVFEAVPAETGFVVGGQVGAWTGERNTHLNLFVRYASGLAAYGEFTTPGGLGVDRTTSGARELQVALGGNWEGGPLAVMLGGYFRSFRNASPALDAGDVDEGIAIVRPQVWFTDWVGLGVEGSYQVQHRGALVTPEDGGEPRPLVATMPRFGVLPFVSPAGRGSFSRPMIWLIYTIGLRDAGARALYPVDDPYNTRATEHFLGAGAEWWFGSTSYGGGL